MAGSATNLKAAAPGGRAGSSVSPGWEVQRQRRTSSLVLSSKDKLKSARGTRGWDLSGQKPRNSKNGTNCNLSDHYNTKSTSGYQPPLNHQVKRRLSVHLNLCYEELPKKDKTPNGNGMLKKSWNPAATFANLGHDLAEE